MDTRNRTVISLINEGDLCNVFHCLPSQLRKEDYKKIELIGYYLKLKKAKNTLSFE